MTMFQLLIEAREIISIMKAPSFKDATNELTVALGIRIANTYEQLSSIAFTAKDPTERLDALQLQMIALSKALAKNDVDAPMINEVLDNVTWLIEEDKRIEQKVQFRKLIGFDINAKCLTPFAENLVLFNDWLIDPVNEPKAKIDQANQIIVDMMVIHTAGIIEGAAAEVDAAYSAILGTMQDHKEHLIEQMVAGEPFTRLSIMDDGVSWDSIPEQIQLLGTWVPQTLAAHSEQKIQNSGISGRSLPHLNQDEDEYLVALKHCIDAYITPVILPGIDADLVNELKEQLTNSYMQEYKNDKNFLSTPVADLTKFSQGLVELRAAATMNVVEARPSVIKAYYGSQMTKILDDIMGMKGTHEGIAPNDHLAAGRLMQMIQIAGASSQATAFCVNLSPSTIQMEKYLLAGIIKESREMLEDGKVTHPIIRSLLTEAVAVIQQAIYSCDYKHDPLTEDLKQKRFSAMFEKSVGFLADYYHGEFATLTPSE